MPADVPKQNQNGQQETILVGAFAVL